MKAPPPQDVRPRSAGAERDEALVARVADGNSIAYEQLVLRHADRFLALAERLLGERMEAEDALQEAFGKLWSRAGSFNPDTARFTTWFYRVVANACYDRLRRRRRMQPLPEGWDAADDRPGADETIAEGQRAVAVRAALDGLPERQRLAVVLCYFEDISNIEAAETMEISVKALESLLVRARKALRDGLATERE